MRDLSVKFETRVDFSDMVSEHDYILRCIPQHLPEQQVLSLSVNIDPATGGGCFGMDSFGNRTYAGRIAGKHKFFTYGITARIRRDDLKKTFLDEPLGCLSFPSELTKSTEGMEAFLDGLPIYDDMGNYDIARILSDAVYDYFQYVPESTHVGTSAAEAFESRQGVCQDYAHVFLALARMKRIPSRYVSGLPEGDGSSHAWVEIWYDGLWYGFDPTRNKLVDEGYVKLCVGRDFKDCPIERGRFFGSVSQSQTTWMEVK